LLRSYIGIKDLDNAERILDLMLKSNINADELARNRIAIARAYFESKTKLDKALDQVRHAIEDLRKPAPKPEGLSGDENEYQKEQVKGELAAALAEHRPGSHLTGVLVAPMRRGGTELLVGVVTDPDWGKVLSVGLGGLWVEVFDDVSLRLLPVDEVDVAEMLAELRSAALLKGVRDSTSADIDRLCQVITRIVGLAEGLGSALDTLEVNPLRVDGADVEVLDALVVWKGGQL